MSANAYSSKVEQFFTKRFTMKAEDFIETKNYEQVLRRVWKPKPISRFHIMTYGFSIISLLLAYFIGGIFCYFTVGLMMLTAWGEFKRIRRDTRNMPAESETKFLETSYFTQALYSALPLQVAYLIVFMLLFSQADTTLFEKVGLVWSCGYIGAVFGINIGHELIHRRDKFESNFGGLLLSLVCYATFKVEHVRGHHVYVSTPEDASSAPLGMSLYKFLPRAWVQNPINGFRLEAKRLKGLGLSPWHWRNELIWWTALSFSFGVLAYVAFGLSGVFFFYAQAFVAITILEIINYVEHYGLERKKLENGRYERVTQHHSWNASEKETNTIMFNLQRHSDHHANPTRPYQLLRHFDESPQLPTGYFGMLYLAFWPKKWFEVMNPRAKAYMDYVSEQRELNNGKLERV
jgi:alkane 1-monooxygenase